MSRVGAWGHRSLSLISVLLILWPATGGGSDPALLVTIGEVTETTAVVWARAIGLSKVAVEYGPRAEPLKEGRRREAFATATADFTVKIPLTALSPSTHYDYRVSAGPSTVVGQFRTAPAPRTMEPVKFLWSGDLGGSGNCRDPDKGYPIFTAMNRLAPDFFLFVGDTIYADHRCAPGTVPGASFVATTLEEFRIKHRYNRADPLVQTFFRNTSVYAIWDDHEVVNDFDPSNPLMPVGRQAFLEYWPIIPPAEEPTRLYRRARWGQLLDLLILDTRQYRSPNSAPDGPGKSMLGERQRGWLLNALVESDAVWKIVVTSVTLSVPTGRPQHRDGWASGNVTSSLEGGPTGFGHELREIVRSLADHHVRNVVWITTDVHHAEVIRYNPRPDLTFYELIAGPLAASRGRPRSLDQALNPVSLFARGDFFNFGQVAVEPRGLTVRIYDEEGKVHFEQTFPSER